MNTSRLKVTGVTTRNETAVICFDDKHEAHFEGYSHGWGYQIEGLRSFCLRYKGREVVHYDARLHRAGPQPDEHKFTLVAAGYTIERIVDYWSTAKTYLHEEYFEKPYKAGKQGDPELWLPWRLTSAGWVDLNLIKEGRKPLPEASPS